MPSPDDVRLLIRQFRGVDRSQDPAYISPEYLQAADNFVPSLAFVLARRQGETLHRQVVVDRPDIFSGPGIQMVPCFLRTYDDVGNRYILVLGVSTAGSTAVLTSLNDATFLFLASGFARFPTAAAFYSAAQLGNRIYVGNGVDPLFAVILGSPVTGDLSPFVIGSLTQTAGTATDVADDTASQIFDGTYSWCYAVYDSVLKRWTQRGDTQAVTVKAANSRAISFTAPTFGVFALGGNEKFHLFVTQVNDPIELATDQSAAGLVAGDFPYVLRNVDAEGSPLPLRGQQRTGNLLLAHRSRIWVSGDQTTGNGSRVYATNVILPGAEQALFDQQPYFPQNAVLNVSRQDGDRVTAIGLAALTVTADSPDAPLLIFKTASLWAFFGDILGDPNAQLLQLSGTVGCAAPLTVVTTPFGTLFMGLESVYLVRPDTLTPIDVGYPINPLIRSVPAARRLYACATYHRGFYKLAIPPGDGTANTQQWWLDLRRGLGTTPSWWGPHTAPAVIAFSNARQDTDEVDRALALQSKGNVERLDQANVYTDLVDDVSGTTTSAIPVRLQSAVLDDGAPFDRKRFTRIRGIVRTGEPTTINASVSLDSSMGANAPGLNTVGGIASAWDGSWDGTWSGSIFTEVESVLTDEPFRAPHRTAAFTLQHGVAMALELHDLEVRYQRVDRPGQ